MNYEPSHHSYKVARSTPSPATVHSELFTKASLAHPPGQCLFNQKTLTAVTNAQFASLHGLPVAPFPLDDARSASQTARSSRACMVQGRKSGGLPSAARRRALRSGCVSLDAPLRPPLHLPRSPTTDRSLVKSQKRLYYWSCT